MQVISEWLHLQDERAWWHYNDVILMQETQNFLWTKTTEIVVRDVSLHDILIVV